MGSLSPVGGGEADGALSFGREGLDGNRPFELKLQKGARCKLGDGALGAVGVLGDDLDM